MKTLLKDINIQCKAVSALSDEELKQCMYLNAKHLGSMRRQLTDSIDISNRILDANMALSPRAKKIVDNNIVYFIKDREGKIAAWALTFKQASLGSCQLIPKLKYPSGYYLPCRHISCANNTKTIEAYFWTRQQYRKQGLASLLLQEIRKDIGKIRIYWAPPDIKKVIRLRKTNAQNTCADKG